MDMWSIDLYKESPDVIGMVETKATHSPYIIDDISKDGYTVVVGITNLSENLMAVMVF